MSIQQHRRSPSVDSFSPQRQHRSPSPPFQTFHHSISVPTPSLVESVAGGAHYSGVHIESDTVLKHRRSSASASQPHNILKHDHKRVLDDLTELYCCRPSLEIFERSWNPNAVFEGPFSYCKGFNQYAAQWFALPTLIMSSQLISQRIMSSTAIPNRFIYQQNIEYTIRFLKRKMVENSIIVVDLDENDKVMRLVDQWNGKEAPSWFGASFLRHLNAKVTPWLIHVPKSTSKASATS